MSRAPFCVLISTLALGCGGSAPPASSPTPVASTAPASMVAPDSDAGTSVASSVVHFDDLGVSLDVPLGMRVVGDDELASRIRSAANPRLTASLEQRGAEKKGLPLLTLSKETTALGDGLTLTLTAARVPADATSAELLAEQRNVMIANLADFTVVDGPKDISLDGVPGTELADTYSAHASSGPVKTKAVLRLYIRHGLAFVLVAGWPGTAPTDRETEARSLLAGLHFYPPTAAQ
ncbi:MAG: hypothetical protein ABI461_24035 [Polyangiaceae bacterium]